LKLEKRKDASRRSKDTKVTKLHFFILDGSVASASPPRFLLGRAKREIERG